MEKLQSYRTYISIPLLFLLHFSSILSFSLAYTLPDKYFLNCGSSEIVKKGRWNFTGDESSGTGTFSFSKHSIKDNNQSLDSSSSPLYQTARIFRKQSWYEFDIDPLGAYLVRLHFFAFSSSNELSRAIFDVSASGFLLLQNFTAKNNNTSPLVKEFFLGINTHKFRIYFTPQESSLAFVNAIEVFPSPGNFSPHSAIKVEPIPKLASSSVLQTIYRINVGGRNIDSDEVGRKWDIDDTYLYYPKNAKNSTVYSGELKYQSEDKYIAPKLVYKTAKQMNISNNQPINFNITWGFYVNKTAEHLIRVHFCDIIADSQNVLTFHLYINGNLGQKINSFNHTNDLGTPFHIDFVVGFDDSTVINISIGTSNETSQKDAFLNGLEILEIMDGLASVPTDPHKINVLVVVGSVLGGFALLCILVVGWLLVSKHRKQKPSGSSDSRLTELTSNGSTLPDLNLGLKISFAEIQLVTKNFDSKLIVGKGGFGSVYKGTLSNGTKVAVKRSAPGSGQGIFEFQTEILVLTKIRHRHLVSLIGYCDERNEMILVYEFMENGTLRDHLYDSELPHLSWKQRLEICIGAASGLHYLHKGSAGGIIIHRDVKSTNILLDENHVAKVADFGLSKSGPLDETHVSTNVKGTFGYLDPEYFKTQQLTDKSDVYSFGVVLLEVLCARQAIDNLLPREQVNLADWGLQCKQKGLLEEIVDPSIKGQINPNSLRKFSETAEKCLQEDRDDRPMMSDVIWDLEYALQLQETAVTREPHEDSTANASSALVVSNLHRFPSLSTTIEGDDSATLSLDLSNITASSVFSS
ncbi:hypothetical protein UlMin_039153 [Ulmus minor]